MTFHRYRARSFTLVLTLFLAVMIVVTTGALALTGSVESLAASQHAELFEHELAVDNYVACLPQLLKTAHEASGDHPKTLRLEMSYNSCTMTGLVSSEGDKLNLATTTDLASLAAKLRDLAQRNGLPEASVRILPLAKEPASAMGNRLFWFSQIVQPTQYEEVFHWAIPELAANENPQQKTW